jgi:hypothetical protein
MIASVRADLTPEIRVVVRYNRRGGVPMTTIPSVADAASGGRRPDSLGVLETTRPVVDAARLVRIDLAAVAALAEDLARDRPSPPAWDAVHHYVDESPGGEVRTAQYILVLDALNFCFWGEPRWQVEAIEQSGGWINGYYALAVALKRAILKRIPLLDAGYLASLTLDDLRGILRGRGEIPLLAERLANLREVGRALVARHDGQFANLVRQTEGSAVALTLAIAREFQSFDDATTWRGGEVRFYKRAQICVADLAGSLGGRGLGRFDDLDRLTAFADYKVPQVLRRLGVLVYAPELAVLLDARTLISAGGEPEVEIRAATVWGVELLRRALAERGVALAATEIDWLLWERGQRPDAADRPYHLTPTIYY